jgi:hypothetical protein
MSLDRGQVAKLLGAPTDQEGSVNDPRTREEQGLRFNEKWIYRAHGANGVDRIVLWKRYDLVGVFRVKPDGSVEPESLPDT